MRYMRSAQRRVELRRLGNQLIRSAKLKNCVCFACFDLAQGLEARERMRRDTDIQGAIVARVKYV